MDATRSSALICTGLPLRSTTIPASRETYLALARKRLSEPSRWSSKTSAIATSSTFSFPVRRFTTACVPRPPQPTSPAFNLSFEGAPRARAIAEDAARNVRRDKESETFICGHHTARRTRRLSAESRLQGGPWHTSRLVDQEKARCGWE